LNALMLKDNFAQGEVSSLAEKLGFKDIFITLHDILFISYHIAISISMFQLQKLDAKIH
jgi:hypothetical protein